jgi:hypothetical protein
MITTGLAGTCVSTLGLARMKRLQASMAPKRRPDVDGLARVVQILADGHGAEEERPGRFGTGA